MARRILPPSQSHHERARLRAEALEAVREAMDIPILGKFIRVEPTTLKVRFVFGKGRIKTGQSIERYRAEFQLPGEEKRIAYGTTPEAAAEAAYLLAQAQPRRA